MVKKCYTTKYRKRQQRERQASIARKARAQKEEALYWDRRHKIEAAVARARAQDLAQCQPLVQAMVNILANRICDLDPRYRAALHLRKVFEVSSLFGVNPWPHFPTLPE